MRSSITLSFTGSLPEARLTARSLALWTVKLPLICARPPRIGSLMFGADRTLSSRMIANGLPTFSCVTRPKRRAPAVLKVMSMSGAAVLVEALLGVGQLIAGDHDPALDRHGAGAVGHRQHLAARRRAALLDVLRDWPTGRPA